MAGVPMHDLLLLEATWLARTFKDLLMGTPTSLFLAYHLQPSLSWSERSEAKSGLPRAGCLTSWCTVLLCSGQVWVVFATVTVKRCHESAADE
mmetsp:Transcript_54428/g.140508  ORF Transcript_54428/g.140508 Transcript_54428/m.140508 type:complete len:93 (+) Transcript_54428:89-367(+)